MPATRKIECSLTEREIELLRNATDFATFGCTIAAIEVDPVVEFEELETIRDQLSEGLETGTPPQLDPRQLEVLLGLLKYQEIGCPIESWCDLEDVEQEELSVIRNKLAALMPMQLS